MRFVFLGFLSVRISNVSHSLVACSVRMPVQLSKYLYSSASPVETSTKKHMAINTWHVLEVPAGATTDGGGKGRLPCGLVTE
jgi:hypothetical protein